jgi:hypothetical protein
MAEIPFADITVPNWSWEDQIIGIGLEGGIFSCQSIVLVTIRLLGMAMCIARIVGRNGNWIFVPFFTFISEIVRPLTQPYRMDLNIGYSILLDSVMLPIYLQHASKCSPRSRPNTPNALQEITTFPTLLRS